MNPKIYWVGVVALLLALSTQQALARARWKGIAEEKGIQAERAGIRAQTELERADSIARELAKVDSTNAVRRIEDAARITAANQEIRHQESRSATLEARLEQAIDPAFLPDLRALVASKDFQIDTLRAIIQVERSGRAAELILFGIAQSEILMLRSTLVEKDEQILLLEGQAESLGRALTPSLGLRLKADWWLAVGGLVLGYMAGNTASN